jgi:hypothetical protein
MSLPDLLAGSGTEHTWAKSANACSRSATHATRVLFARGCRFESCMAHRPPSFERRRSFRSWPSRHIPCIPTHRPAKRAQDAAPRPVNAWPRPSDPQKRRAAAY